MTNNGSSSHPHDYHRFIDEAGDLSFFGKGRIPIIGNEGVSRAFMLGMVKYKQPLTEVRRVINDLTSSIESDPYFNNIPSVRRRIEKGGFFLHAKDDPPELRYKVFEVLRKDINFTLQVVVGRKSVSRFVNKHNRQEREFYADLLSRMLHDKGNYPKLVLNIADRGSSTRMQNLEDATKKAEALYLKRQPNGTYAVKLNFNVQPYRQEPLLTVVDYGLWAVQRVFEKGETRFYEAIRPNVRYIVDVYCPNKPNPRNRFYSPRYPLTESSRLT